MIDAHLLLNLGRPQGDGLLLGPSGAAPGAREQGQHFAEALRQVHATGRQRACRCPHVAAHYWHRASGGHAGA